MSVGSFNLRVYALIVNEYEEILLSDEYRFGKFFTKFPGGGVEQGEGIIDALHREISEELHLDLRGFSFFFVNDFYQASAFDQNQQLVSFYYRIHIEKKVFPVNEYVIPFKDEGEKQRWKSIANLTVNELTFPIDKIVLEKLQNFNS